MFQYQWGLSRWWDYRLFFNLYFLYFLILKIINMIFLNYGPARMAFKVFHWAFFLDSSIAPLFKSNPVTTISTIWCFLESILWKQRDLNSQRLVIETLDIVCVCFKIICFVFIELQNNKFSESSEIKNQIIQKCLSKQFSLPQHLD